MPFETYKAVQYAKQLKEVQKIRVEIYDLVASSKLKTEVFIEAVGVNKFTYYKLKREKRFTDKQLIALCRVLS